MRVMRRRRSLTATRPASVAAALGLLLATTAWGCVGRWFAGRWHTPPAQQYIRFVKKYLRERIWTKRYFQQP